MDIETAREYCLAKKGSTESLPFDEYSLVIKVMDKMFALIDLEGSNRICLKCNPDYAIELREEHTEIIPARYFNKKYWNQFPLDHALWLAFIIYLSLRGITQGLLSRNILQKSNRRIVES